MKGQIFKSMELDLYTDIWRANRSMLTAVRRALAKGQTRYLTIEAAYVLLTLANYPNGLTINQIARLIDRPAPMISRDVNILVDHGDVTKEAGQSDARLRLVRLNAHTDGLIEEVKQAFQLVIQQMAQGLSAIERLELGRMLTHLNTNLEKVRR